MYAETQFVMPFAEKDEVSIPRVCSILACSPAVVMYLIEKKCIRAIRRHPTGNWFVSYASVNEFCNRLREKFCIADRRPRRDGVFGRYKDSDLLPFPYADTILIPEAARLLRYSEQRVRYLCEQGTFDCYRLHDREDNSAQSRGGEWRISKASIAAAFDDIHRMARS